MKSQRYIHVNIMSMNFCPRNSHKICGYNMDSTNLFSSEMQMIL